MSKFITISLLILFSMHINGQQICNLTQSQNYENLYTIDAQKIKCLAMTNENKSLFYTFGIWCEPCRLHFKNAISFAKQYNLNFYVILIENDSKNNAKISSAINFLKEYDENLRILLVDNSYGSKPSKKNKNFLTDITPSTFENIDDMSKYILINNQGIIEAITNYKDFEGDDWHDDSGIISRKLLPLVK